MTQTTYQRTLEEKALNLLRYEDYRGRFAAWLVPKYLSPEGAMIYRTIKYLSEKGAKEIPLDVLAQECQRQFPNEDMDGVITAIRKRFPKYAEDSDPKLVVKLFQDYYSNCVANTVCNEMSLELGQRPITTEKLGTWLRELEKTQTVVSDETHITPVQFSDMSDVRLSISAEGTIGTGFAEVDRNLGGGIRPGELGVIGGAPKRGKTTILCNIGAAELSRGFPLVYVSVADIGLTGIKSRFGSVLSGKSTAVHANIPEIGKALRKLDGKLYVADLIHKKVKLSDIDAAISFVKEKHPELRLALIDRAESLFNSNVENPRMEMKNIFEGLRSIAYRHKVAVWADSQADSSSYYKKNVRMGNAAEDKVWKAATLDLWMGVGRDEQDTGLIWLTLEGRRNIPQETHSLRADWDTFRLTEEPYGD